MATEKIIDYISGSAVLARPEEIYAVQPFSRILHEDYGYQKEDIITHPQYRVKKSPSDKQGYPIDIAVFDEINNNRFLKIIVECKKPNIDINDTRQLEIYMSLSGAEIGVMYNGEGSIYLKRTRTKDSGDIFERINFIPKKGEKLSEIGKYTKNKLETTHNLKSIFSEIRGWIVANGNITRDEDIAIQMINLMLCKIYDERFTPVNENLSFRTSLNDTDIEIKERINKLFLATRSKYDDVLSDKDDITFDGKTLRGIIGRLQRFSIISTDRDSMADAFEIFVGKSVKETEGQFFTPRNVIKMMVTAIDIKKDSYIIDSACGSGGFLVESLKCLEEIIKNEGNDCGWSESAINEEVKSQAIKYIRGLEKDPFLTKLSKSYMAILGDGKGGIFREDSLENPENWSSKTRQQIKLEMFDYLLANPPFGKNIKVEGDKKLAQYKLAYKQNSKGRKTLSKTGNVSSLFLERNLQLLKPGTRSESGGKLAIILPEPYFALSKYAQEIDLMFEGNNVQWIIDLPQNTFRPHNNAKCCAIIIQKDCPQQPMINMAVAEFIGHDHQGKPLYDSNGNIKDDSNQIILEMIERRNHNGELVNDYKRKLTFTVPANEIIKNKILIPRYYWNEKQIQIEEDAKLNGFEMLSIKELIKNKVITFFCGHGSPKGEMKGMGDIPYIRVKDIVNWQVYTDVTSLIPLAEYEKLYSKDKALKPKDILYVSRGSYRIGSVAMISPYDGNMLLTREIIVIRVNEDNNYGITPEYLLYALSHKYVWEQTQNKIFYEPCLPNIGSRWQDIKIPIPSDKEKYDELKWLIYDYLYNKQWGFRKGISDLKTNFFAYLI